MLFNQGNAESEALYYQGHKSMFSIHKNIWIETKINRKKRLINENASKKICQASFYFLLLQLGKGKVVPVL
jgi:hypothetical protein